MCIVAAKYSAVTSNTSIVAIPVILANGERKCIMIFVNKVQKSSDCRNITMILPFPRTRNFQMFDTSGKDWNDFINRLNSSMFTRSCRSGGRVEKFEVNRIGNYIVSVAETIDDLERINEEQLPIHHDMKKMMRDNYSAPGVFSFLVCRIADDVQTIESSPIAYMTDMYTGGGGDIFVPTKHCESRDGQTPTIAHFDHSIFLMGTTKYEGPVTKVVQGFSTDSMLREFLCKMSGISSEIATATFSGFYTEYNCNKYELDGMYPNVDIVVNSLFESEDEYGRRTSAEIKAQFKR
jgi:hypothetical protein